MNRQIDTVGGIEIGLQFYSGTVNSIVLQNAKLYYSTNEVIVL